MKRFLALVLTLILLTQALPLSALAVKVSGKPITEAELAEARSLAGVDANAAIYHNGMSVSASMNATQLRDWLDEQLSGDLYSVGHMLARAGSALSDMEQAMPNDWQLLTQTDQGQALVERCRELQLQAEDLRQTLRFHMDRLEENITMVDQMGNLLNSDLNFEDEVVRYSERIRNADRTIKGIRQEIVEYNGQWIEQIALWQSIVDGSYSGDNPLDAALDDWLRNVFESQGNPQTTQAIVTTASGPNTRASRMKTGCSVLSNADTSTTVTVLSKDKIGFQTVDDDNKGVQGVKIGLRDADSTSQELSWNTTDSNGIVQFSVSDYTVDADGTLELYMEADAVDSGYQSFRIPRFTIQKGHSRKETLSKENGEPYIYSATFNGYDIMRSEHKILYSKLNDADFPIRVEYRNSTVAPVLCYGKGSNETVVDKAFETGENHRAYSGKWKQLFKPDEVDSIYFRWGKDGSKVETMLKPIWSVFDQPTDLGALLSGLSDGFSFSFKIPFINRELSIGMKGLDWTPSISVDPMGSVVITIGKGFDKLGKKDTQWKNKELQYWEKLTKKAEQETKSSDEKMNYGALKQKLAERKYPAMMSFGITFGVFLVASGKWQRDDDNSLHIDATAAIGGSVTLCFDFTKPFVWPVVGWPGYFNFNFALTFSASFELSRLSLVFVNSKLQRIEWGWKKNITLQLTLAISASLGVGIKDVMSLWIKGYFTINFIFGFIAGRPTSKTIIGSAGLVAGATLLFMTISFDCVHGNWQWYPKKNGPYSLLDSYMDASGQNSDEEEEAGILHEPETYPRLTPQKTTALSELKHSQDNMRILALGNDIYAFLIQDGRIHWFNLTKNTSGSVAEALKAGQTYYDDSFDVVNMKDYAFDVAVGSGIIDVPSGEKWTMNDFFVIAGVCTRDLDEKGRPVQQAVLYTLLLWRDDATGDLSFSLNGTLVKKSNLVDVSAFRTAAMGGKGAAVDYIGTNPQILGTEFTYKRVIDLERLGADVDFSAEITVVGLTGDSATGSQELSEVILGQKASFHGKFDKIVGRVMPKWETFTADNSNTVRKNNVTSGKGSDYARVDSRYLTPDTWVAVCRSGEGAGNQGSVELYDESLAASKKSVVLAEGDVYALTILPGTSEADGCTLFYAENVGKAPEEVRYRLNGLRIDSATRQGEDRLKFSATGTSYDVILPTPVFKVHRGKLCLLYWISAGHQSKEGENLYRMCFAIYDPTTNMVVDDAVFAEFSLGDNSTSLRDYFLADDGTWYFTAAKSHEPENGEVEPSEMTDVTLYSFTQKMTPVLEMKGQVVEDLLVCPGEFDDVTVSVMNSGNLAATEFDVNLVLLENGNATVSGTLHADLMEPENSRLTMGGKVVSSGEKAFYRLEDYDFTPRQRDFVIGEAKTNYTVENGALKSAVKDKSQAEYIATKALLPGALANLKGAIRIPDDWEDEKEIELRVVPVPGNLHWVEDIARAEGRDSLIGLPASNRGRSDEEAPGLTVDAPAASVGTPGSVKVSAFHDLAVEDRVYAGPGHEKWLSISVTDLAHTAESIRLYAEVYLDDATQPVYVSLPYYPDAVSDNATHTYDMPLSALVDPYSCQTARVVIRGVNLEETALINNEFTLYLDGASEPLALLQQLRDVTVQPGETATFSVQVTGGVWPYSYKWQVWDAKHKKWIDLKDSVDPTITRENIEKKWDGMKIRCVITDRAGTTIISDEATLRVREKVPTGDRSNLPLYLAVAAIALALLWLIRRRMKRTM